MTECFMQKPLKDLVGMKKVCKGSYDLMITKVDYKRGHTLKWNLIFDKTILDSDWNIYFSNIFRCTIESKMRSFQYKILLRVIPTNKYLHTCQISNTEKCFFCYVNVETIEHLFWYCSVIKTFWFDVFAMFDGILNIHEILTAENILLGYKRSEHSRLINHLLILIKHYIYKTKSLEQNLNVSSIIHVITNHAKLERIIAERKGKNLQFYYNKWGPILNVINIQ